MTFEQIFIGSEKSHGRYDPEHGHATEAGPATPAHYAAHLAGTTGLGLVPVRADGTCRFGAIDIDVDTVDHGQLWNVVTRRKMPLTVCRSKSGGAHLYMFIEEPGLPAARVQQLLKKWAAVLGFPTVEVFPKQVKVTAKNLGNWINLPYYAGERTTRYAVGPHGALTLEQFCAGVEFYTGQAVDDSVTQDLVVIQDMPPCLGYLTTEGLPEGSRNEGLFNFAVYYRKSSPNGWEDKVVHHNQKYLNPPLSNKEVQTIIKSASRTRYQYRCEQEPLVSHCDRKRCLTLPFGVGNKPWDEAGTYDDFLVTHLRKILTDPPRYKVEVNGQDVELSTEEFITFGKFKKRLIEVLDLVIPGQKQDKWEQTIRDLLREKKDITAPKEASERGMVLERVHEFWQLHDRAKTRDDLLRGLPFQEKGWIYFRAADLGSYLQSKKFFKVEMPQLFQTLHALGCRHTSIRVKGKVISVWSVPVEILNQQTEDFDVPEFGNNLGESL